MAGLVKTQQKPQTAVKAQKAVRQEHKHAAPQQIFEAPESARPEDVLAAQQQYGNQAVQRAVEEQGNKADSMVTDGQGNLREDLSNEIQQARGSGGALPKEVQAQATRQFGRSFNNVRIHTDDKADKLSRNISARAFTIGSDIFFKNGVFAPDTQRGRETLLHELTHVVQQSGSKGGGGKLKLGERGNAMEKEAEKIGRKGATAVSGMGQAAVQKEEEEEELQMEAEEEEELQMEAEPGTIQRGDDDDKKKKEGGTTTTELVPLKDDESDPLGAHPGKKESSKPEETESKPKWTPTKPSGSSEPKAKGLLGFRPIPLSEHAPGPKAKPWQSAKPSSTSTPKPMLGSHSTSTDSGPGLGTEGKGNGTAQAGKDVGSQATSGPTISQPKLLKDVGPAGKHKQELLDKIKNASTNTEEYEKARDEYSSVFTDDGSAQLLKDAETTRKQNVTYAAQTGDKAAQESLKTEHTFTGKLMNKIGKAQKFYSANEKTISKVTGFLGGLFGKKDKDGEKDKDEKGSKASATVNIGAGGGGGGGAAGMIAELYQENKQLKEQVKKLQEEKKPGGTS